MKKCCRNCADSRKQGYTTIYCRFYGMPVSASYSGCKRHRSMIVEIENAEDDSKRVPGEVRKSG